jgi:hypothetical protein
MLFMTEKLWNKIEKVAAHLQVKEGTRRQWKSRGYVPSKWHFPLTEKARKSGVRLSIKDLHSFGKAPE